MKELILLIAITALVIIPIEIWYDNIRRRKGFNDKPQSTIVRLVILMAIAWMFPEAFYKNAGVLLATYFLLYDFSINISRWRGLPKDFKNRKFRTFIMRLFYHGNDETKSLYDRAFQRIPPQMELLIKCICVYVSVYLYL